ncbi:hypothetical protein, variant 3 [Puccinia striiformis f. sp. tritici PST-78]|uniref:Uncharacterized protein n=1 Tax=Puccinia striiformis f. sp. tritici PST-78 TaxID=1165861 RepID=A0A0L0V6W8_9BASI|nr:hypothetical protein, variant 3 [Puccinia striiformis f. sp. tritici PST-78]
MKNHWKSRILVALLHLPFLSATIASPSLDVLASVALNSDEESKGTIVNHSIDRTVQERSSLPSESLIGNRPTDLKEQSDPGSSSIEIRPLGQEERGRHPLLDGGKAPQGKYMRLSTLTKHKVVTKGNDKGRKRESFPGQLAPMAVLALEVPSRQPSRIINEPISSSSVPLVHDIEKDTATQHLSKKQKTCDLHVPPPAYNQVEVPELPTGSSGSLSGDRHPSDGSVRAVRDLEHDGTNQPAARSIIFDLNLPCDEANEHEDLPKPGSAGGWLPTGESVRPARDIKREDPRGPDWKRNRFDLNEAWDEAPREQAAALQVTSNSSGHQSGGPGGELARTSVASWKRFFASLSGHQSPRSSDESMRSSGVISGQDMATLSAPQSGSSGEELRRPSGATWEQVAVPNLVS